MRSRLARSLLAIALTQSACWSFQYGARGFVPSEVQKPFASNAILRVNEAGVAWGNGGLGPTVQQGLLSTGLFEHVYYPVEPSHPPELVVEVEALGHIDHAAAWASLAAMATVYFFFLPAPVLPYFDDYRITCDVRVRRGDEVLREFQVETKSKVVHAILADPEHFVPEARERVFRDLSDLIADGVAQAKLASTSP